jgi:uncharacterized protein
MIERQKSSTLQSLAKSLSLGNVLRATTALVIRFPVTTVIVSALLAVAGMGIAQSRLTFHTSRSDLLDPNSAYNRRWLEYTKEFGDQEDVVVVVQGENREALVPVIEEIAGRLLRAPECFKSVFYKIDQTKLQSKGLYYLEPRELQDIEAFMSEADPVLRREWSALNLGGQLAWFCGQLERADVQQLQTVVRSAQREQSQALSILATALGQAGGYHSPWPEIPAPTTRYADVPRGYLLTGDDRVGMLLLWLVKDNDGNFAEYAKSLGLLRDIVAQVKARHPETTVGLTGLPVMENDEMESSTSTMTQAGILSFVGVAVLYVAGFGCFRHPIMAVIALMLPMAWSFGYITLAVGHLNILSSAFGTIVIGLGSDFAVYHIAQYLRLRGQSLSTRDALLETARSVGPGITTGALSTALAFFVIGLTGFPGVAELGIVAGGGIVLCWVAAMTVLPAMIQWYDNKWPLGRMPPPLDLYVWLKPLLDRPRLLVTSCLIGTALLSLGIGLLWYDHNLLNLQAVGLESVELEKQLLQRNSMSASFAVSIAATPEELVARKKEFLALPLVDSVREIATCVPERTEAKRPIIERIHRRLADVPHEPPTIPVIPLAQLDGVLARLQQFMVASARTTEVQSLQEVRSLIGGLSEQEYFRRLSTFQQAMAADLLGRLHAVRSAADPEPPRCSDLPEGLVSRFVGRDGRYLMQIYSKADVWNMESMEQFVQQVRSVDPDATGNPMQVYESSRQMKRAYEQAAWYALIMVVATVYLDFRSVRATALALVPLALAMLQLFGLMGLLNIPLNPANMIVLPLILGVGVDIGVHIVHDYHREPAPYRMSGSTTTAIVVNTLMNMVGFGSLMIASHRGIYSLGRVLTLGMTCNLLSGLVMPSLLRLLQMMRRANRDSQAIEPPTEQLPDRPQAELAVPRTVAIRRRLDKAA